MAPDLENPAPAASGALAAVEPGSSGPPTEGPPTEGSPTEGSPTKGRPKKAAADRRTGQIRIRVTPREKARIEREAQEAGLSASDYLRRRALDRPVEARVDADARALLRRLGVNLNQLVRVAHRAGQVERGDELGALLAEVRSAVVALGGESAAPQAHVFPWHQG